MTIIPVSPWDIPGIDARLRELHAQSGEASLTMAEMAEKLSFEFEVEITKNALIGRCHRIGLPPRGDISIKKRDARREAGKMIRIRVRVDAPIPPIIEVAGDAALTLQQLRQDTCRWPLGKTSDYPPYLFCGEPAALERSYCLVHHKEAHGGWRPAK